MIVFKGMHGNMSCTMGKGTFKYDVGKKATAAGAKTANMGLHSCREPFGILQYYGSLQFDCFCICEAGGDINEDEYGRVSSTELTPLKKLTPQELAVYEAVYLQKHPQFDESRLVMRENGEDNGFFAVVRGKNPVARAKKKGVVLCLLQEYSRSRNIKRTEIYEIDGKRNKRGIYGIEGRQDE